MRRRRIGNNYSGARWAFRARHQAQKVDEEWEWFTAVTCPIPTCYLTSTHRHRKDDIQKETQR